MTREEAINHLGTYRFRGINHTTAEFIPPPDVWQEALEMAIAALREQDSLAKKTSDKKTSEWISVEERLPQETGEVCRVVNLMMDNGLVTAGWLNDITGFGYFLDSRSSFIRQAPISRFTHWMPLP